MISACAAAYCPFLPFGHVVYPQLRRLLGRSSRCVLIMSRLFTTAWECAATEPQTQKPHNDTDDEPTCGRTCASGSFALGIGFQSLYHRVLFDIVSPRSNTTAISRQLQESVSLSADLLSEVRSLNYALYMSCRRYWLGRPPQAAGSLQSWQRGIHHRQTCSAFRQCLNAIFKVPAACNGPDAPRLACCRGDPSQVSDQAVRPAACYAAMAASKYLAAVLLCLVLCAKSGCFCFACSRYSTYSVDRVGKQKHHGCAPSLFRCCAVASSCYQIVRVSCAACCGACCGVCGSINKLG